MSSNQLQFVEPLKNQFLCQVCKEPWDPEAVTQCVDCQATFCKPCYDEAMMKEAKCHSCSKQPATFGEVHRLVRSVAESFQVYCGFKSHGCGWTGKRSELSRHVEGCPKRPKDFTYVNDSEIPDELRCPICSTPFVDPVQLPCEHVFCRKCITRALELQPRCPTDRQDASVDQLKKPPAIIDELLDDLKVYCANKGAMPAPCTWTGRRRDYIGHRAQCKATAPPAAVPVPSTSAKMTLETITEFSSIEAGNTNQEIYAMAHLTAPKIADLSERKKPLSISAVIDVSGSMSGSKLNMAKDSLKFMIDELSDRDYLGIIAFHTDVSEPLRMTKMTPEGKALAKQAADSLYAQSCTNLSGGLFAGMNQVLGRPFVDPRSVVPPPAQKCSKKGFFSFSSRSFGLPHSAPSQPAPAQVPVMAQEDTCRAVLLFTDGIANGGITDERTFVTTLQLQLQGCPDMVVHTFGFGGDHNASLLQRLSETGHGSYYYIQDVGTMKESFADCLGGLLSTVAQNIKLRINALPGFAISRVMTTYKTSTEGTTHVVGIHDVYSGEQRDVLVLLTMTTAQPVGTKAGLVAFEVQYDSLLSSQKETVTADCSCATSATKTTEAPNTKVDEQRARILATEALAAARDLADRGQVKEAKAVFKDKMCALKSNCQQTEYVSAMMQDMDKMEEAMDDEVVWAKSGTKAAAQISSCHAQQRMNRVDECQQLGYDNSFKMAMRSKARK